MGYILEKNKKYTSNWSFKRPSVEQEIYGEAKMVDDDVDGFSDEDDNKKNNQYNEKKMVDDEDVHEEQRQRADNGGRWRRRWPLLGATIKLAYSLVEHIDKVMYEPGT